jgi:ribosome-binding factor A
VRRRPSFTRADRLGSLMRDEVERILAYEVRAAVVRHVQVTETVLSGDLGHLRVRYVMQGTELPSDAAQEALDKAAGFVARNLAEGLQVHRPPKVVFSFDREYARLRKLQEALGVVVPTDTTAATAVPDLGDDDDDFADDDWDDDAEA